MLIQRKTSKFKNIQMNCTLKRADNNKVSTMENTEIKVGDGIEVKKGALVFIHYDGHLEDGTLFDSSHKAGRHFEFVVGSKKVIQGMSLGVLGMRVETSDLGRVESPLFFGGFNASSFADTNQRSSHGMESH